jgi:hypothetical protein
MELSVRARHIYESVVNEMQEAEEIEGVEGQDYINLMASIAQEASKRIENFLLWHNEQLRNGGVE